MAIKMAFDTPQVIVVLFFFSFFAKRVATLLTSHLLTSHAAGFYFNWKDHLI